jgi:putative transposase
MARSPYKILDNEHPYFHTCTVVSWLPVFTRPETADLLLESFQFLRIESGLELYGYVILENHLHFVCQSENHSADVRRFKSYTARKIIDHLEYIHHNPVKRGYVDDPLHWRRSSARNYAGLEGLIEVTKAW